MNGEKSASVLSRVAANKVHLLFSDINILTVGLSLVSSLALSRFPPRHARNERHSTRWSRVLVGWSFLSVYGHITQVFKAYPKVHEEPFLMTPQTK